MRASCVAAAVAVVAGLGQAAFADFASSVPIVVDTATLAEPTSPEFTVTGGISGSNVSSADGSLVFDLTLAGTGPRDVFVLAQWSSPQTAETLPQIVIFTGTVSGAFLSSLEFDYGESASASWTAPTAADGALVGGANRFSFNFVSGTYALTSSGGFGAGSTYTSVAMTFQFPNTGDQLQLDAVSNPEPGTFALFGLGAAGLAWAVRRRRAAKRAAKA
jgi:hypothetical protein